MIDPIDRQAAIDAVANHCIAVLESHTYDSITTDVYEMAHRHIIDVLRVFPSVQPEIVRCKDCKHFAGEGMYCACDIIVHYDHFYCYHGERRTDE